MLIGTLASPEMLSAPHSVRREHAARNLDAGIDHVFVADHVSFHVGAGIDGLINAATLTALDPRLKVCVGVYLLAPRHPVTVARQLATLAETAPGQVLLGIGVGGEDRNEFAMCGVDPRTRGARTDEALARAARFGDGWLAVWCSPQRYAAATAEVDAVAEIRRRLQSRPTHV